MPEAGHRSSVAPRRKNPRTVTPWAKAHGYHQRLAPRGHPLPACKKPNCASAQLSARAALAASGALPENVNYAVKISFLLSFLESVRKCPPS